MNPLPYIQHLDHLTFSWCLRRKRRAEAIKFSRYVSFTADGPLYALIGFAFILAENWLMVKILVGGFALERCFYFFAKTFFKRNRPPEAIPGFKSAIIPSDKFSFPSGHTSAAFFMACALSFYAPFLAWILFPWAISVGSARVMLGVHFPTDTLAGAAMGSSFCLLMISWFAVYS